MNSLHPIAAHALKVFARAAKQRGLQFIVTSRFRSIGKQRELYARWLRGDPRIILPARPGRSTHNYGLSFDVVSPGRQEELRALGEALGLVTLGPKDPVHFQVISIADWNRLAGLPPAQIQRLIRG